MTSDPEVSLREKSGNAAVFTGSCVAVPSKVRPVKQPEAIISSFTGQRRKQSTRGVPTGGATGEGGSAANDEGEPPRIVSASLRRIILAFLGDQIQVESGGVVLLDAVQR